MIVTKRLAQGRIYYGWYIVATAFIAQAMSIGLQSYTFGIFLQPMGDELGWSRGELSAVQSVSTLVNGLLAIFIGSFLDKRGGRELMVVGAVISGIGLAAISVVQGLWQFYLIRGVLVTVGMLFIGNLVVNVAISNWFVKQRGRAVAVGAMGVSFAGMVFPPLTQTLISAYGWRSTWIILGIIAVTFVAPVAGLLMCRRPEDIGLRPDGDRGSAPSPVQAAQGAHAKRGPARQEYPWTRRQAMRTSALWLIIASFALASTAVGAMILHLYPYLSDKGFSPQAAAAGVSMMGLTALVGKPFWGFMVERISCKYVAALDFFISALGLILILLSTSTVTLYATVMIFGLGMGGFMVLQEVTWADYFGRLSLGAIRSVGMPIAIVTSAGAPFFAGAAYDLSHSYNFALSIFAAANVLAAIVILISRRPVPPATI